MTDHAMTATLLALGLSLVPVLLLGALLWLRSAWESAPRPHGVDCPETCRRERNGALCGSRHDGCWCGAE